MKFLSPNQIKMNERHENEQQDYISIRERYVRCGRSDVKWETKQRLEYPDSTMLCLSIFLT